MSATKQHLTSQPIATHIPFKSRERAAAHRAVFLFSLMSADWVQNAQRRLKTLREFSSRRKAQSEPPRHPHHSHATAEPSSTQRPVSRGRSISRGQSGRAATSALLDTSAHVADEKILAGSRWRRSPFDMSATLSPEYRTATLHTGIACGIDVADAATAFKNVAEVGASAPSSADAVNAVSGYAADWMEGNVGGNVPALAASMVVPWQIFYTPVWPHAGASSYPHAAMNLETSFGHSVQNAPSDHSHSFACAAGVPCDTGSAGSSINGEASSTQRPVSCSNSYYAEQRRAEEARQATTAERNERRRCQREAKAQRDGFGNYVEAKRFKREAQ